MAELSFQLKTQTVRGVSPNSKRRLFVLCNSVRTTSSNQKQLENLDSYFGKLKQNAMLPPSISFDKKGDLISRSPQIGSPQDFLWTITEDVESGEYTSSGSGSQASDVSPFFVRRDSGSRQWKKLKSYMKMKYKDAETYNPNSLEKGTSGLHAISMLVSLNIAVFLFELASPIKNSDIELFSLPSLYGAKINNLILLGEWWRLLTPMFLHSGIFHIAFGCWALLTFGTRVCRAYGSFTFFLIYLLGGVSGNLTSFLHTPEPTVGGTGPVFALIGAWLVYQIQNKDVISKPESEDMFQKAIVATVFSFVLSNFGPIDDWTHVGAVFTGVVYGFLTSPVFQMEDRSSKSGQEDGIAVMRRYGDPCKSLAVFSIIVLLLDLGGNTSTSFMLIFAMLAGVTGICSVVPGVIHHRVWRSQSLAGAATSAITSWAITALTFGLVCKEIALGGHRGKRLQTLEAFIAIATASQLLYLILLHAGMFSSRYGPSYHSGGSGGGGGAAPSTTSQDLHRMGSAVIT